MRKIICSTLLCLGLLCGCSKEEVVEEVPMPDLTEISDSYTYYDIGVKAIGEHCGFAEVDDGFEIHPFNNSPKHISVKRILLSENNFWDTILLSEKEDSVVLRGKKFSYFTTVDGTTYGYYEVADYGYIFTSYDLPSSYVKAVLDRVWVLDS